MCPCVYIEGEGGGLQWVVGVRAWRWGAQMMERIQFPSSPSGFNVRVLQALFACIRRKKLVAVSSLYSKSV